MKCSLQKQSLVITLETPEDAKAFERLIGPVPVKMVVDQAREFGGVGGPYEYQPAVDFAIMNKLYEYLYRLSKDAFA